MTDVLRLELGGGPLAVRTARRAVREILDDLDGDVADTAALLVSELVTNALLHVGGRTVLVVQRGARVVRIEVHDGGSRLPSPSRTLGRERTSGRGLQLLDELSARWGAAPRPGGKVVWCEVELA